MFENINMVLIKTKAPFNSGLNGAF